MNGNLIGLVKDKIEEYGIPIFNQHEEKDQHLFFCQDMVVFVFPNEKLISVAFQATTHPEDAAQNILILKEIPDIEISIMDPFIITSDGKLIEGDETHKTVISSIKTKAIKEFMNEEYHKYILNNHKCFDC